MRAAVTMLPTFEKAKLTGAGVLMKGNANAFWAEQPDLLMLDLCIREFESLVAVPDEVLTCSPKLQQRILAASAATRAYIQEAGRRQGWNVARGGTQVMTVNLSDWEICKTYLETAHMHMGRVIQFMHQTITTTPAWSKR